MNSRFPASPRPRRTMLLAAAFLLAAPAAAQERDVARQSFYNFFDSNLDVDVTADAAGRLRLIRGQRGRIDVAAHAPDGVASFGFDPSGPQRLSLTALGAGDVDFVVVVPEEVRVRVALPNHRSTELFGSMQRSATYRWDNTGDARSIETVGPATAPPSASALLYRGATPDTVLILGSRSLGAVTVRIEGDEFRITGERGAPGFAVSASGSTVRLEAPRSAADAVVTVPEGSDLLVRIDGRDALSVWGGVGQALCEPVTEQRLGGGRAWFTFTPAAGLRCAGSVAPPRT